jgi:hypothetical protein
LQVRNRKCQTRGAQTFRFHTTDAGVAMPHLTDMPALMGHAEIEPGGPVEAGSYATLTYTYTAGKFGIDDTGGIKVCWRATSDMAKPQFTQPAAPNYVTVKSSNGVALHAMYDARLNIRPWPQTIFIRTISGFLRAGDTIAVVFGDRSGGSPGMRMQTNVEDTFEFRTLADPLATYEFVQLPRSPEIALVSGPPVVWRLILPTEQVLAEPFRLAIVPEDRWGNPTFFTAEMLRLEAEPAIAGLEAPLQTAGRSEPLVLDGLTTTEPGDHRIRLLDAAGRVLATSNPMRAGPARDVRPYWADMHGQSEETIGTNSADAYFRFARDKAFLDVAGHQGNDFQITPAFWRTLNQLTPTYNAPGRFVTIPGYEWSGNTGMGGDRNVFYEREGEPIYRSSRVLVELPDTDRDCNHVSELFEVLAGRNVAMVAHVGGRYADLHAGHDGKLEHSVEVHSSWGTFEWLLHDAFALGFRAGIVCNSDDHKGRQGATSPGASQFGARGGLTCLLMPKLDRESVFAALRRRRHYGTTGCRMLLHVEAHLPGNAELFDRDPALFEDKHQIGAIAEMGRIVRTQAGEIRFDIDAVGSAPIERIDVFNGREHLARFRGFETAWESRRFRVLWQGAEYRGRGRQTIWDGSAEIVGNRIVQADAVNFLNADNPLRQEGATKLSWKSVTTGNMAGVDVLLEDSAAGELRVVTGPASVNVAIGDIGEDDVVVEAGGLERRIRVFRLPEQGGRTSVRASVAVALRPGVDNPVYARVTQEDGHQAWSSPIYFIP